MVSEMAAMENLTIRVPPELAAKLRNMRINTAAICRGALEDAVAQVTPDSREQRLRLAVRQHGDLGRTLKSIG